MKNKQTNTQQPWFDLATHTPEFSEYCHRWQNYVLHSEHEGQLPQLQRSDNLPRLWPENKSSPYSKIGILCVHGFNETAFGMLDVALAAQKFGARVQTVLLPGHCTSPVELANTDKELWLETVAYGIRSLRQHCDKVILIGNSIGATLSCIAAHKHPDDLAGLLLLSPAFGVCSITKYLARLYHLLRIPLKLSSWHKLRPENDYARYCSTKYTSGLKSISIMRIARKMKIKFNCPSHIFLSVDDETIDVKRTLKFFAKQRPELRKLDFYSNRPRSNKDQSRNNHSSKFTEYNVLNFSHTCLQHTPDNKHYGFTADYYDFAHTRDRPFGEKPAYFGALTPENIQIPGLARLHFNPDFPRISSAIENLLQAAIKN
jgi:esterase/lipase